MRVLIKIRQSQAKREGTWRARNTGEEGCATAGCASDLVGRSEWKLADRFASATRRHRAACVEALREKMEECQLAGVHLSNCLLASLLVVALERLSRDCAALSEPRAGQMHSTQIDKPNWKLALKLALSENRTTSLSRSEG